MTLLSVGLALSIGCNDGGDDDSSTQVTPSPSPGETSTPLVTPTPYPTPTFAPTGTPGQTPGETPSETPGVTPSATPTATPAATPTEPPTATPDPGDVDHDGDGYTANQGDCDDSSSTTYPGASEICGDGVDNGCTGQGDEACTDLDADGDGYSEVQGDCNDEDDAVHPGATDVPYDGIDQDCSGSDLIDVDGDGYSGAPGENGAPAVDCDDTQASIHPDALEVPYDGIDQDCQNGDLIDVDGDGYNGAQAGGNDCDDQDPNTYPGATEFADGKDNNCDGKIDNDLNTYDDDGDGTSEAQGDCDDSNSAIHPGATEVPYDGIDQDCQNGDLTDVDGDGYAATQAGGSDCNDQDKSVNPGAKETPYDGIDQDCKNGDLTDVDGDGYVAIQAGGSDCNDQDKSVNPGAKETPYDGIDQDCSGKDLTDVDGDGYDSTAVGGGGGSNPTDCDDANAAINPAAKEVCDTIDNNCDGVIDSDAIDRKTYYMDNDHDGYGDPGQPVLACSQSGSLVTDKTDCDDQNASIHPGAAEVCDSADNDCDGQIDESGGTTFYYQDLDQDGYGNPNASLQACSAPSGYVLDKSDCKDTNDDIHPGATELCNGIDDDCDTQIDEGVKTTFYLDADKDGYGTATATTQACSAPAGYTASSTDCNDGAASIYPGASEVCDGIDQNCNSQIDEGVKTLYYQDADGDGFGTAASTTQACSTPSGYVTNGTDCNDSSSTIYPGATEVCNGLDDNCNQQADEGVLKTFYQDLDGDGYGNGAVTRQACSAPTGYVADNTDCDDASAAVHPGAAEVANGIDDNCDGNLDEGVSFVSCKAILAAIPGSSNGKYTIDPDGPSGSMAPFQVYCDMTTEGGGWTFLATVTNSGDGANQGNWLHTTPVPNSWESTTATFGTLDPALNADFRSAAFHSVKGTAVMITHRNLFLLRTADTCLASTTLRDRFAGLGWTCAGSQDFTSTPTCTNACSIVSQTVRSNDTALLAGATRARLFFKAGEADGAQDSNKDRVYLSTSYRDNVDYDPGLGAFCSGANCSPRTGEADVDDKADAIVPTAGTEFYGLWIR